MLSRLKKIFEGAPPQADATPSSDQLHIAAAALLVRAAQIDGSVDAAEEKLLARLVGPHFGLNEAEAADLLVDAKAAIDDANDLYQFTQLINKHFGKPHKRMLVELLWQVVLSDGVLDDYEANLLRRVGGLIYVSDTELGAARKAAEAALGESAP